MTYHLTKTNIHAAFVSKGLISDFVSKRSVVIKKLPYCKTWKIEMVGFDGYFECTVVYGYGDFAVFFWCYDDEYGGWCSKFVCRITVDELKRFGICS